MTHISAASVRARLYNKAKASQIELQMVLTRYALERLLYRLSISRHKDSFLLKGALLFDLWFDVPFRPTRDIDLLGFGIAEIPHLVEVFEELCKLDVNDGISFDVRSIQAAEIRKEANYAGIRLTMIGLIDGAKCPVQVDIGYGDAVTPEPEMAEYPAILEEMPAPHLRVYPRYTVIAEKLEAMVSLGMANTRMKDYFDLWVILHDAPLSPEVIADAVRATFARRGTVLPQGIPMGLSDQFAQDEQKRNQWNAFIRRNHLNAEPLSTVVQGLRDRLGFLMEGTH